MCKAKTRPQFTSFGDSKYNREEIPRLSFFKKLKRLDKKTNSMQFKENKIWTKTAYSGLSEITQSILDILNLHTGNESVYHLFAITDTCCLISRALQGHWQYQSKGTAQGSVSDAIGNTKGLEHSSSSSGSSQEGTRRHRNHTPLHVEFPQHQLQ